MGTVPEKERKSSAPVNEPATIDCRHSRDEKRMRGMEIGDRMQWTVS